MSKDFIRIGGAREHNLKNLTLNIPRDKLVVITGLSGSGKSSLAFDTIYAEGQRKYVESLSAYARQFLDQMQKPDVDFIEGLSPAIAIEQRSSGSSPRSIIATTTEIYDYLRLLYAHVGQPYCPETGVPIVRQTTSDIVDRILALPPRTRVMLLAPVVRGKKGEFRDVVERLSREGFVRARVDGELVELANGVRIKLDPKEKHTIDVGRRAPFLRSPKRGGVGCVPHACNEERISMSVDPATLGATQSVSSIPRNGEEPVFREPWKRRRLRLRCRSTNAACLPGRNGQRPSARKSRRRKLPAIPIPARPITITGSPRSNASLPQKASPMQARSHGPATLGGARSSEPRTAPRLSYGRATSAISISSTKVSTSSATGMMRERATSVRPRAR